MYRFLCPLACLMSESIQRRRFNVTYCVKNGAESVTPLSYLDRGTNKSSSKRELLECYRGSRTLDGLCGMKWVTENGSNSLVRGISDASACRLHLSGRIRGEVTRVPLNVQMVIILHFPVSLGHASSYASVSYQQLTRYSFLVVWCHVSPINPKMWSLWLYFLNSPTPTKIEVIKNTFYEKIDRVVV
jgi:hypothetical protein